MPTATQLAAKGAKVSRAGIWEPRARPGGFEDVGVEGLTRLKEVGKKTGMYISTEAAIIKHVYECLEVGIDVLWVGARATANPFTVQEIADALRDVDTPVLVKNPVNPNLGLWIDTLERINNAGLRRLGATHRGFNSYDKKLYRNLPQRYIPIELCRRIPGLPIPYDSSYIGEKYELVAPLYQQAMDLNFDGLVVESHCNPGCAWSNASQQVTPDILDYVPNLLTVRKETQTTENLNVLCKQIDECDDNIIQELAKRMRIAHEIGTYEKEHDITVLQTGRRNEILEGRGTRGGQCGMGAEFVRVIFEAIHEESIRQQMEIVNKQRIIHTMRVLILGAGEMGSFFVDILNFQHETTVFGVNPRQLRSMYNTYRSITLGEIKEFEPELVVNTTTVKCTLGAFRKISSVLPKSCILSDIASVKTGLKEFYEESGFCYVSTHPMFGPTFTSLNNLSSENAIIISENDRLRKVFLKDLYNSLDLNIFEYTFDEHSETVAYSLSIPFVPTFVFAAVIKHQETLGTTFKRHMVIAKGFLSEDSCLLQEIPFNLHTSSQVENICTELKQSLEIITSKDVEGMKECLTKIWEEIK